jgi:hypothetical protein
VEGGEEEEQGKKKKRKKKKKKKQILGLCLIITETFKNILLP